MSLLISNIKTGASTAKRIENLTSLAVNESLLMFKGFLLQFLLVHVLVLEMHSDIVHLFV